MFAAERSSDGALTVMAINKVTASTLVSLSLAHFTPGPVAQVWTLTSSNTIQRLADVTVSGGSISTTLAAQSITLFVVPVGSRPTFTLTVTKSGDGDGTVTSTPAGIACGTDCSEAYASSMLVSPTPTPISGSVFAGWAEPAPEPAPARSR